LVLLLSLTYLQQVLKLVHGEKWATAAAATAATAAGGNSIFLSFSLSFLRLVGSPLTSLSSLVARSCGVDCILSPVISATAGRACETPTGDGRGSLAVLAFSNERALDSR